MVSTRSLLRNFFSRLFSKKDTGFSSGEGLALRQVTALRGGRKVPSISQIRQFPRILSGGELRIFFAGIGLLCAGALFLLLGLGGLLFTSVPRSGGTLTEGMLGYPQLINPLYADANSVDRELSALIYSGLLAYDPTTQTLQPALADALSVSEDEKMYTLTLKQGILWQDGEPFAAHDVLFTFNALQNSAYGSPLFDAYQNILVNQVDDQTVTFTLSEPYAAFPELLTVGILPAHLWEEVAPSNAKLVALNLKPVGTGPYILEKTSKDSSGILRSVTLRTSETYVGTRPYLDDIIVKFFSSPADILQAVQTKRIDATAALSLSDALALTDDSSLSITALPLTQYVGAFFNTKKDLLAQTDMRKALTLALDVPAITADATGGLGTPLGFALPGFFPTSASVQDTQTAGSLLDTLGYTLSEDGTRAKNGTPLSLTITTAERPELTRAAERIADAWRSLGITVSVNSLSAGDMTTVFKEKTYDVLIAAEQYGVIADPYPFWHSSGKGTDGLNMSQFSTSATDEAVSTLRASSSLDKRGAAYTMLSQAMIAEMPAVFLFQNVLPLVHTTDIKGVTPQTVPSSVARWTLEASWYKRSGLSWKF